MMTSPVLSIRDLTVTFRSRGVDVDAVRSLSFDVMPGETVAVVGESGSGKSTTAAAINRLLPGNGRISSGTIMFGDIDVTRADQKTLSTLRGAGIGLVPQDPMTGLNPVHKVGEQITEALLVQGIARGAAAKARAIELLTMVGIPQPELRFTQYPHQFSGGMRQRALIAIAMACDPRLLIADEPTSALDVTVQRKILDELDRLTKQSGTSLFLITHDLAMAAERADRIIVMYRGECVETGLASEILANPQHEYTRRLLAADPVHHVLDVSPRIAGAGSDAPDTVLEVRNVTKSFAVRSARPFGKSERFLAVDDVSFSLERGRTVSIVGESGSGKSTTANMILGLENPTSGSIVVDGIDTSTLTKKGDRLALRRRIQPVFQNPFASLDPRLTIEEIIEESLIVHRMGTATEHRVRVSELLDRVQLPQAVLDRYPHELSGGQNQRVGIARALAVEPEILVLDEAVSALDVLVQAHILELLVELKRESGVSYLFISHDLAVVRMISDTIHVMRGGKIVESGTPEQIFTAPRHPYTQELLGAIPGIPAPALAAG